MIPGRQCLSLALVFVVFACGGAPPDASTAAESKASPSDSAHVSHAHSSERNAEEQRDDARADVREESAPPTHEAHDTERWSVDLIWQAGAAHGPEQYTFNRVTSVGFSPDGRIYAIDFGNQHIKVFDGNGTYVRTIGRAGAGPGEFAGPLAMAWDATGRLWVPDGWNRRYTVFDSAGAVVATVPRAITSASGFRQRLVFLEPGILVDETAASRGDATSLVLVRVDTTGAVLDTALRLPLSIGSQAEFSPEQLARGRAGLVELGHYLPRVIYTLAPDGTLWTARSDSLRLYQQSLAGEPLRTIAGAHRQSGLTAGDRRRLRDALQGSGIDLARFSIARPIVQSIIPLNDGHVLAQIAGEPGAPGHEFDVFNPAGRHVGSVRLPLALDPGAHPAVRGDTIVGVTRDSLDVSYLVRYTLRRPLTR